MKLLYALFFSLWLVQASETVEEIVDYIFAKYDNEHMTWYETHRHIIFERHTITSLFRSKGITVPSLYFAPLGQGDLVRFTALQRVLSTLLQVDTLLPPPLKKHLTAPLYDIAMPNGQTSTNLAALCLSQLNILQFLSNILQDSACNYSDWHRYKLAFETIVSMADLLQSALADTDMGAVLLTQVFVERIQEMDITRLITNTQYRVPLAFQTGLRNRGLRAALVPLSATLPLQKLSLSQNAWLQANVLAQTLSLPVYAYEFSPSKCILFVQTLRELADKLEPTHQRFLPLMTLISTRLLVLEEYLDKLEETSPPIMQALHDTTRLHLQVCEKGEKLAQELQANSKVTLIDTKLTVQLINEITKRQLTVFLFQVPANQESPPVLATNPVSVDSSQVHLEIYISDNYAHFDPLITSINELFTRLEQPTSHIYDMQEIQRELNVLYQKHKLIIK